MTAAPRALFVRFGVLGDFILTLPVLEALLAAGEVDVVCAGRFAPLLAYVPGAARIGRVWDSEGADVGWLFGGGPAPRHWDVAVGFSPAVGVALRRLGVPTVHHVAAAPDGPAARHFGAALELADPVPRLRVDQPGPPRLLLAPGASSPAKRDPPEWWEAVAAALSDLPVAWVLGPEEAGESWPGLIHRPDLVETARLAARSVWVGADSGPGHLAAAAGAQVISRFRVTDPVRWAPHGARVYGPDATATEVAAGVRVLWNCAVPDDSADASG